VQPAIVFAAVMIVPFVIALLAIRFSTDTRLSLRSAEEIQASYGLSWDGRAAFIPSPPKIVLPPAEPAGTFTPFPTLRMLDRIRGDAVAPFTTDPRAQELEIRASALTGELWPDSVWLTGLVSPAQVESLTDKLETERQRGHDAVRVLTLADDASVEHPAPAAH
jgi:hypothetical protein